MDKDAIRVRMSPNELEGLQNAYRVVDVEFIAENQHEVLLAAHSAYMLKKINQLVAKDQGSYLFSLTPIEAIAYCQLWMLFETLLSAYEAIVVQKIFSFIHKNHSSNPYKNRHGQARIQ